MTTGFWLTASVLIAIAFAFLLPPLWRRPGSIDIETERFNVDIAKQRLLDLKEQRSAGTITADEYEDLYQELQSVLADDLQTESVSRQSESSGRWLIVLALIVIPLVSVTLYRTLGNADALLPEADRTAQQIDEINAMVSGLAQRLQSQPDDAEGWLMLGRSYKYMNRYAESAQAFSEAYRLLGDRADVLLQYADALAMANDGRLAGKPAEFVAKALKLAPDDSTALWLSGMAKAEAGKYDEALRHWQKLAAQMPKGSEPYREVQGLIAQVMERLGTAPVEQQPAAIVKGLKVNVAISDELQGVVSATDTVFVYAQALQGPPMPLAIVKMQVADLPVTVVLSDEQAMMPAMKLSNFDRVKISARISMSGQAESRPGDWIGIVESVAPAETEGVTITIDQKVQ
ncbi:c-type cytochrome biogenesis protein CcmI [Methylotuvimicrobium alcaliphilum]|uniref:Cytochrome c-type biogenesis protein CcmI n=1 Tax=Methylotuvimicrobium alcaliphilum (strain DSM 19304 / NCIMB 14124 / VKM B-2133 / 20Z) TaxID=1091494 RepID=G4SWG8_META2|nr:c-type cytochrome biogenesis protein CcmI [Methylotuvimicrobium alcaliphilum]CCE24181.1 Cytochrome c-type biogenesis protein CcmI [Methylotuvimicrobium alcaliphilum 20Z]